MEPIEKNNINCNSTTRAYHVIVENQLYTKYYCLKFGALITKEASGTQVLGILRKAPPRQRTLTHLGAGQAPDILKPRNLSTTHPLSAPWAEITQAAKVKLAHLSAFAGAGNSKRCP
ncbi:MAG: hypothetical protein CMF69_09695 [Magnetovibrio sp.]|nr:hypothetical protein [Magnetovibrio sp.]